MSADLTVPVDSLHLDSCAALAIIRAEFADARRRAALWQPTTWPPRQPQDGAA